MGPVINSRMKLIGAWWGSGLVWMRLKQQHNDAVRIMRAGRARDLEKTRARGRVHQKPSGKSSSLPKEFHEEPRKEISVSNK